MSGLGGLCVYNYGSVSVHMNFRIHKYIYTCCNYSCWHGNTSARYMQIYTEKERKLTLYIEGIERSIRK